jgi:hypothetical protein
LYTKKFDEIMDEDTEKREEFLASLLCISNYLGWCQYIDENMKEQMEGVLEQIKDATDTNSGFNLNVLQDIPTISGFKENT